MTKKLNLSITLEVSEDTDESQVLDALLEIINSIMSVARIVAP